MLRCVMRLTLEADHLGDLIDELQDASIALAKRHGARFRALDRRIEALVTGPIEDLVDVQYLGQGRFVGVARPAFSALLADLRAALAT